MRKGIFFTAVVALCALNFGAFAATSRADSDQTKSGVSRVATTRGVTQTEATTSPAVVSRAATQKAINTGTKVASATENTTVPKECQDAFYGCMDAFCMLDNASGGRCQCSDRITELDEVLEDILKLDEQTYLMATEGVERILMGEAEEQVIARAKAAGEKVVVDESASKRKSRTLDLSLWNNTIFTDNEDVFDAFDSEIDVNSFASKKGDALYRASANMCGSQIPESCQEYGSMLQLVYAQKIKSDCVAYENSLRAQKSQSTQKLQTAQKALRDAALEEYQNQNKYATLGECVTAFTECIQTTAGCEKDYTGCVILAAQENVRSNIGGSKAKQTKIKGAVKGADITLAAFTMEQLLAKKPMCENVTKQCVNANKNDAVWEAFLHNAAPALKSAELIAEQNLRSNCLPTLADCFKTACREEFTDEGSYDICLSNPDVYKSFCKVQLEPCLEATGGTYDNPTASSLWNGLVALLNAMKVDACTAEVKSCLMDQCGSDYSECIGLDVESIGRLCPKDKLVACMDKYDEDTVEEYVAQVAQGLAVQIDNALVTACQNSLNDAMIRVCGDTESCEAAEFDLSSLKYMIKPMACRYNNATGTNRTCYPNVAQFGNSGNACGIYATLTDKPAISAIIYTDEGNFDSSSSSYFTPEFSASSTNQVVSILNGALNRIMSSIEVDPKVQYCMYGRQVQGFYGFNGIDTRNSNAHFENLTKTMRSVVADYLLSLLYEKNVDLEDSFADALDELSHEINERLSNTAYSSVCGLNATSSVYRPVTISGTTTSSSASEQQRDSAQENLCTCDRTKHNKNDNPDQNCLSATDKHRWMIDSVSYIQNQGKFKGSRRKVTDEEGIYDATTNMCTIRKVTYECAKGEWTGSRCKRYNTQGTVDSTTIRSVYMNDYYDEIYPVNSGKKPG